MTAQAAGINDEVPVPAVAPQSFSLAPIALDEQKPLIEQLSSGLHFICDSDRIPREIQARLSQLGFKDVSVRVNMDDSKSEARKFLKDEVGLK